MDTIFNTFTLLPFDNITVYFSANTIFKNKRLTDAVLISYESTLYDLMSNSIHSGFHSNKLIFPPIIKTSFPPGWQPDRRQKWFLCSESNFRSKPLGHHGMGCLLHYWTASSRKLASVSGKWLTQVFAQGPEEIKDYRL